VDSGRVATDGLGVAGNGRWVTADPGIAARGRSTTDGPGIALDSELQVTMDCEYTFNKALNIMFILIIAVAMLVYEPYKRKLIDKTYLNVECNNYTNSTHIKPKFGMLLDTNELKLKKIKTSP